MTYNAPHKKVIFVVLIFSLIFGLSHNVFAYIFGNGAGCASCDSDNGEEQTKSDNTCDLINNYIEEGAGYFLDSYGDVLRLLNRVELSDQRNLDYDELNKIVDSGIRNLKSALQIYEKLIKIAELTPYNEAAIYKLETFDYKTFMEKNDLIPTIFNDLQTYLQNGNITGIYKRIYSDLNTLLNLLYVLKSEVSINKMPALSVVWKLNKKYSYTLLFGQYISEVFYSF
jgi:hypothetical protein